MATGGRNMGRVGVITHRERHDGGFNIVHIKDVIDNSFATRESNVFVIGKEKPWISLPKGKGVKVCLLYVINLSFKYTYSFLLKPPEDHFFFIFNFICFFGEGEFANICAYTSFFQKQLSIAEERDRRRANAIAGN